MEKPVNAAARPDSTIEQARSAALFDSIGDGAILTDERGVIQQINKTALSLLGCKKSDMVGKWFPEVVEAEDSSGKPISLIDRPITRSFITGKPVAETLYYKYDSTKRFAAAVTVSPIVVNGTPVGAIEIFRDITREQEIDKMKSDFISIASHQLRTPLTAFKTYTHILFDQMEDDLSPEAKKYLHIIFSSVTRMNEIIDTLLNISRIEAGILSVKHYKTDVSREVRYIFTELESLAAEKNITYALKGAEEKIFEKTDPILFTEIISNLISNAIKYTPPNGEVQVSLKRAHGRTVVSVKDNGYGIPIDLQKNVFTKFFRSPQAVISDANGSGLGLYMAKQVADALGGKLYFKSVEDEGSKFSFAFPRID